MTKSWKGGGENGGSKIGEGGGGESGRKEEEKSGGWGGETEPLYSSGQGVGKALISYLGHCLRFLAGFSRHAELCLPNLEL